MDLDLILERLRLVTETKNNSSMCVFLGFRQNASGSWKRTGGIPYKACFLAAQKTGYLMEWIITGEGPQKHGEPVFKGIDADRLINDFAEVIVDGVELGFLRTTRDTSAETLEILGRKLYNRHTGLVTISLEKQDKKHRG